MSPIKTSYATSVFPAEDFWQIDTSVLEVNTAFKFVEHLDIGDESPCAASAGNFMSIFYRERSVFYSEIQEVLDDEAKNYNLHFNINRPYHVGQAEPSYPEDSFCESVLQTALLYLRNRLGQSTKFAISQAHRNGMVSFRIVCPQIAAPLSISRQLVADSQKFDLGMDYTGSHFRMVMAAAEDKPLFLPLEDDEFRGIFSDHVVQAVQHTNPIAQTHFKIMLFDTIEEVILAIDFSKLDMYTRKEMFAALRERGTMVMHLLFKHKMQLHDATSQVDRAWDSITPKAMSDQQMRDLLQPRRPCCY